jgi:hypothetical protein
LSLTVSERAIFAFHLLKRLFIRLFYELLRKLAKVLLIELLVALVMFGQFNLLDLGFRHLLKSEPLCGLCEGVIRNEVLHKDVLLFAGGDWANTCSATCKLMV